MRQESFDSIRGRLGFADVIGEGDFRKLADFASHHELRLVQISLDNPRYFPERFDGKSRRDLKALFSDRGIGLCFHGPSDIPLMNRHEKVRLAGLERVYEMIDMALEMGADYFIFHPGRLAFYSMSTRQVFFAEQRHPERITGLLSDSLKRLLGHCSGRIKFCLENTHAFSSGLMKVLGGLAANEGLSLVWDIGHTELLSEPRRSQLIRFFQANIGHVRLAHIHDVEGERDHKRLGSGRIDLPGYLEIFNAMGIDVILEVFPERSLLDSLEYLKKLEIPDRIK